jgi:hypothetical protein
MARWRPAPAPPEPPARLRSFDPADWPDPADWAEDTAIIESTMQSWIACRDKPRAWREWLTAEWRAEQRWFKARQAWADEHGVSMLDWILGKLDWPEGYGHYRARRAPWKRDD